MTQQGRVLDPAGGAVTGRHDVTVGLYSAASGGSAVWSETFSSVRIEDGYFQVVLGADAGNSLDHTLLNNDVWVGLMVDDSALGPRQPIGGVPSAAYAIQADRASHADTATSADRATLADTATLAETAAFAETAASAETAAFAETAASAETAAFAEMAASAETAAFAEMAASAETAAFAETATTAGSADSATTAGSATSADFATNAGTVGGKSTSQLARPGVLSITYGSCGWTPCVDTPATAVCPAGRFATRVELPEFGGDQSTCGNTDDFRVYCCEARVTIPAAN